jgi:hypothetical protein
MQSQPGLELANPGIIEKGAPLCGIEESYGGTISLMSRLTPIYTIYGLLYTTFGLDGRHTGQAGYLAGLLGALNVRSW